MTRPGAAARRHFPALRARGGRPTPAYLDSACMSLVPSEVLDAMRAYYEDFPGCAGRSVHRFAEEVSLRYEEARSHLAEFLRAPNGAASVVFLRNATEAINLVANGTRWKRGDRIVLSDQEHNSNLVPWQRLAANRGVRLSFVSLPDDRAFDGEAFEQALLPRPRLVSLFHTSNLDGRSLPAREIAERAHDRGARVLFDGCQAAPHQRVDLRRDGIDFYALSSHKMLGPSGTGALIGTGEALADLEPSLTGGETVEWTTLGGHELRPPPYRFEAGLQNYGGVLGADAGVRFLEAAGLDAVEAWDRRLNERATRALGELPRVRIIGPPAARARSSIIALALDGIDPHDAALFLDEGHGVMIRSGRHCVDSWYER
ncbi:MAG: aminotransferase class V-fold PLP-dependent enzyme, partial [Thermoplasmata archaeon]|nr:aminotransferase class V-fold PLP-dependent enzyme [Thermoplasmata archaeon]